MGHGDEGKGLLEASPHWALATGLSDGGWLSQLPILFRQGVGRGAKPRHGWLSPLLYQALSVIIPKEVGCVTLEQEVTAIKAHHPVHIKTRFVGDLKSWGDNV